MATKFKMAAKIQDGRPKGVLIEILTLYRYYRMPFNVGIYKA